jgi:hypothetical protein
VIYAASFSDEKHGLIHTPRSVYTTSDGGTTWIPVKIDLENQDLKGFSHLSTILALDPKHMTIVLSEGNAAYSNWGSAVAPFAELVSRTLWSTIRKQVRHDRPATRLTQLHRREAKGASLGPTPVPPPHIESYCRDCGTKIGRGRGHCAACTIKLSTTALLEAAPRGRIAAQSNEAQARRSETQLRHRAATVGWKPSDLPTWLDEKCYRTEIQPRLPRITLSVLSSKLGISIPYAVDIRSARRIPHRRHWQSLAQLVGVSHA